MRVQINMQTGGFRLAIQRKKCHTGNYSVLSDIFHGLCIFYLVFIPGFMPRTITQRTSMLFLFELFNLFFKKSLITLTCH